MIDRDDNHGNEPPEGLRALERELQSIRIEERASFGPELRAELERAYREGLPGETVGAGRPVRTLLAASLGGLLVAGLLVPQARAGLVRFLGSVGQEPEVRELSLPRSELPEVTMDRPELDPGPLDRGGPVFPGRRGGLPAEEPTVNAPSGGYAFPEILDRGRTQVLIERFYPDSLQALGVGGRVGLLAWISTEGGVRDVRVTLPSGLSALDEAAVLAARELHFRPARRDGVARPAWVEFAIEFRPPPPPAEDTVVLR